MSHCLRSNVLWPSRGCLKREGVRNTPLELKAVKLLFQALAQLTLSSLSRYLVTPEPDLVHEPRDPSSAGPTDGCLSAGIQISAYTPFELFEFLTLPALLVSGRAARRYTLALLVATASRES